MAGHLAGDLMPGDRLIKKLPISHDHLSPIISITYPGNSKKNLMPPATLRTVRLRTRNLGHQPRTASHACPLSTHAKHGGKLAKQEQMVKSAKPNNLSRVSNVLCSVPASPGKGQQNIQIRTKNCHTTTELVTGSPIALGTIAENKGSRR